VGELASELLARALAAERPDDEPRPLEWTAKPLGLKVDLEDKEGERFWSTFETVATESAPRGSLVPDAHLVALMREYGVSTVWSNDRDFRKFDGVTVRNRSTSGLRMASISARGANGYWR
jgi:predicted nucleic acid-binding protein